MIESIAGRAAPELTVPYWIDGGGRQRPPLTLEELGARYRLLFFYQHWRDGCHSTGFPTFQALVQDPRSKNVGFAAVQTAFEGTYVNTRDKLPVDQQRYGLRIPFGQLAAWRQSHDDGKLLHRRHAVVCGDRPQRRGLAGRIQHRHRQVHRSTRRERSGRSVRICGASANLYSHRTSLVHNGGVTSNKRLTCPGH
jgi:hypothetical protein